MGRPATLAQPRQRLRRDQPPLPADFAAYAPGKGMGRLEAHYAVGERTIRRWRQEAGVPLCDPSDQLHSRRLIPVPGDIADRAAELRTIMKLCAHYGRDRKTINRWLDRAGIALESAAKRRADARHPKPKRPPEPKPKAVRAFVQPVHGRTILPGRAITHTPQLAGREQEAAQFLRRAVAVYRCTERGAADQKGKFWRLGNAVITGAELLARAERKGWRPDAWQEIAA